MMRKYKELPNGSIWVEYRLDDHFYMVGNIRENGYEAGGRINEEIIKYFPELAHLSKWHLVSKDGVPMHYFKNALYWFQKYRGTYKVFPHCEYEDAEPEAIDKLKNTIIHGQSDLDNELHNIIEQKNYSSQVKVFEAKEKEIEEKFHSWLTKRLPEVSTKFLHDMSEIMD